MNHNATRHESAPMRILKPSRCGMANQQGNEATTGRRSMTLRAVSAEYFSVHLRALLAECKIAPLGEPVDAWVLDQNDGTLIGDSLCQRRLQIAAFEEQ
ncbi:hypothetical protein [Pseudomonas sp. 37 R 15]|uniref:hypothetical protein n=1 Tax=Pseudomonas sp. 37 R 15 TaxID=1844104 RepID=UPI0015864A44|nr:hypothetical protein [Pseudomonas sp. 37 R 15]